MNFLKKSKVWWKRKFLIACGRALSEAGTCPEGAGSCGGGGGERGETRDSRQEARGPKVGG